MGGLPYMTPLRISWGRRSAIAYKRDFGLGGGPVGGLPRVIDLWWQFARALGIPYQDGRWSGAVGVSVPPTAGAGSLQLVLALLAAGVGVSMALPTVPTAILSAVPPSDLGKASGISNMMQRFGAVFAIAIAGSVFAAYGHFGSPASMLVNVS